MTRTVVSLAGCLCLLAAGCADDPEPVSLPPLSPSATTSATAPPVPTTTAAEAEEERAVRAVYVAAASAYHRAQTMSAHRQRTYLAQWEVDPLLSQDLAQLTKARKEHYTLAGRPVLHIVDVTVDGTTATVEDCVDHSAEYWKDSRTGRAITGSRQADGVWAFTTLTRTADGWRASEVAAKKERCDHG